MDRKHTLTIGITGHRYIEKEDRPIIKEKIEKVLKEILSFCKENTLSLQFISSLAQGGDLLATEVALKLQIPLTAVFPYEEKAYIQSFDDEIDSFHFCLKKAKKVIIAKDRELSFKQLNIPQTDYAYRQADIYIAEHSDILFALWDGKKPTNPNGCGTVETIQFAIENTYKNAPKERKCKCIVWIYTRRKGMEKKPIHCVYLIDHLDSYIEELPLHLLIKKD